MVPLCTIFILSLDSLPFTKSLRIFTGAQNAVAGPGSAFRMEVHVKRVALLSSATANSYHLQRYNHWLLAVSRWDLLSFSTVPSEFLFRLGKSQSQHDQTLCHQQEFGGNMVPCSFPRTMMATGYLNGFVNHARFVTSLFGIQPRLLKDTMV